MKPEAGVTVARPATTPVTTPTMLGLPNRDHSSPAQTRPAIEADRWVTSSAMPAEPSAARALPPLKPYQPTHSMPAPIMVMPGLCGGRSSAGKPSRGPSIRAATMAETPAVACTTRPPAKSITPRCCNQPPPQTQWQTGA